MLRKNFYGFVFVAFAIISLGVMNANAQVVNNWVEWTAPASFPNTATWFGLDRTITYNHTNGLTGTLALPTGGFVTVTQQGEVNDDSCFFTDATPCPGYWNQVGTWNSVSGAWTSSTVPNLPPNSQLVAQTGISGTNQRISFSAPISNMTMNIFSLGSISFNGSIGVTVSFTFNRDFEIVSQDPRCDISTGDYCLWKVGRTLFGAEGSGTIQFTGVFQSVELDASDVEHYNAYQIGVTSEPLFSSCVITDVTTRSMGGWSNTSRSTPLNTIWFGNNFPTGLRIGRPGRSMTLANHNSIREFLPNGGTSAILPIGDSSIDISRRDYKNSLAGQSVAASLNMALSPSLSNAYLKSGMGYPYEGHTVQQILSMANDALGHQTGPLPTSVVLSNLTQALDLINTSFLGGVDAGYLTCQEDEAVVAPGIEAPTTIKAPIFRKR